MVDVSSPGLRRKVAWLIAVRVVICTILLGSAIVVQIAAPGSFPVTPFFVLIGTTYALTIAYATTLRHVEARRWLIDLQLAGDALIVSAFIYFTGGITSYFATLYVLPIVAGSTVNFRRGGLLVATLGTVLYVGLVSVQYLAASGWLPYTSVNDYATTLPLPSVARYMVALNVFGFFAVALLSGSLADSVRSAGARLRQASTEIADLQALNQHVIDSMPSGLATTDQGFRILTFNRAAEAITGVTFRAAVGRPIGDVLQIPDEMVAQHRHEPPQRWRPAARAPVSRERRAWRPRLRTDRDPHGNAGRWFRPARHLPGRHEDQETGTQRRAFSSASPPSAKWRPASPTKSGTLSRRCRDRFKSCGRSCRSAPSRNS